MSMKMEKSDPEALISVAKAGEILGLSPSALYGYKAGTDVLTRVPQGRRVMFVLGEVLEYREKLIAAARQRKQALTLVKVGG